MEQSSETHVHDKQGQIFKKDTLYRVMFRRDDIKGRFIQEFVLEHNIEMQTF